MPFTSQLGTSDALLGNIILAGGQEDGLEQIISDTLTFLEAYSVYIPAGLITETLSLNEQYTCHAVRTKNKIKGFYDKNKIWATKSKEFPNNKTRY